MILKEMGLRYKTDKATHGYLDVYEQYLSKLENVTNVLEIGVRTGASLRMWEEYFPNAHIDGVDICPDCKKHETTRISVHIGDQVDLDFLDTLGESYDFIIDDGSHVNEWTVATFTHLWKRLNKGGIYILEDMGCSYQDLQKTNIREKWFGMELVPTIPVQRREIIDGLIIKTVYKIDSGTIEAMHIHKNFIVLVK